MSKLNFPDPLVEQTYEAAGITWTWNDQLKVWSTAGGGSTTSDTNYTYPGSGFTRKIENRLTDSMSVKDHGAKGDGSDETAIIQTVVDTIPDEGGRIYFPKGDYNFSNLVLNKKKIVAVLETGASIPKDTGLATLSTTTFDHQGWGGTPNASPPSGDSPRPGFHYNLIDAGRTTQWDKPYINSNGSNAGASESFFYYGKGYFEDTDKNLGGLPGEISVYGFDITTNQKDITSIVRGMKGCVRGNGGASNLRCFRLMVDSVNGHTGNITGILMTPIRSDRHTKDDGTGKIVQPYFWLDTKTNTWLPPQGTCYAASIGSGIKYGYTCGGFGSTGVELETCYQSNTGDGKAMPQYSHFFCHGSARGNAFTMSTEHQRITSSFVVNNKGYTTSRGYSSGTCVDVKTGETVKVQLEKAVGFVTVWESAGGGENYGQSYFRIDASPVHKKCWGGDDLVFVSGEPGSGTPGKITVGCAKDGERNLLYFHNGIGQDVTPNPVNSPKNIHFHITMASDMAGPSGKGGPVGDSNTQLQNKGVFYTTDSNLKNESSQVKPNV